MSLRKMFLGSACLAFAVAALAAAPSFAQNDYANDGAPSAGDYDQGPDEGYSDQSAQGGYNDYDTRSGAYRDRSTPAERARTQDLNRRAAPGIQVRPTPNEQESYQTARQRYEQAQAGYNRQLDEYNAKTRAYEQQRRGYGAEVRDNNARNEAYEDERDQYEAEVNPPPPPPSPRSGAFERLVDLDDVINPNRRLFNLVVEDIDGFMAGHFRRLETRGDGARMAVITLRSLKTIAIPVDEVRFDPNRSVVVADWTSNELDRMPPG